MSRLMKMQEISAGYCDPENAEQAAVLALKAAVKACEAVQRIHSQGHRRKCSCEACDWCNKAAWITNIVADLVNCCPGTSLLEPDDAIADLAAGSVR